MEDILLTTLGIMTKWKYLMNHRILPNFISRIHLRIQLQRKLYQSKVAVTQEVTSVQLQHVLTWSRENKTPEQTGQIDKFK